MNIIQNLPYSTLKSLTTKYVCNNLTIRVLFSDNTWYKWYPVRIEAKQLFIKLFINEFQSNPMGSFVKRIA